ncbi:hemolysin family protein [Hansschlegelia zhihuaiae]|uniref:HlyC/CorC family transporter n=1 Tax=Hansschlegelia zhihuaiae TaxID=405005 RepID=A0A4V1KJ62_9HYPH|nr:hemolysin family protein [Hansschlegelia zhihuaiae]RXF73082.1 HlyC/CorC family transporter [Hansschlegelia zhihuaiae]
MPIVDIAVLLGLVLLNGFFALSELAIVSARRPRLRMMADAGDKGAERAAKLADDPSSFLSSVQIGITLIAILTGVVGESALADPFAETLRASTGLGTYAGPVASGLVVFGIGYMSLILGELVPKRIALANPEPIAAFVSGPLRLVAIVGRPFVVVLNASSALILRLLGVKEQDGSNVTEEEVRSVIAEGVAAGSIEPVEKRMIEGVLGLADRPVRSIMTPRREVFWVDATDDLETIKTELAESPFSRIVVGKDGSVDDPVGILHKKDVLAQVLAGGTFDVASQVKDPLYVPEGASALSLLELFKSQPSSTAFVVDEFGGFEGIVTSHDVLGAIAGALPEEHETAEDLEIRRREDGSYMVDGRASLDLVTETFAFNVPQSAQGEFHTAAGLVIAELGRIPNEGDTIDVGGWIVEVVDMDGPRVDKLMFRARTSGEAGATPAGAGA